MKRVAVILGAPRKRATYAAVQEFIIRLKSCGDVEAEIIFLRDYKIGACTGCRLCFDKGEEYCPLKDDRDLLIGKIEESDGIVFATPNYVYQVTGLMKNFLDRLGFIWHRPRFFGKASTCIVTQGGLGGSAIVKYLGDTAGNMGFQVTRGCCLTTLEPGTETQQRKNSERLAILAKSFYETMVQTPPAPSFYRLLGFRIARTSMSLLLDESARDYRYYRDRGWFSSDYFTSAPLGLTRKMAGHFFDFLAKQWVRSR